MSWRASWRGDHTSMSRIRRFFGIGVLAAFCLCLPLQADVLPQNSQASPETSRLNAEYLRNFGRDFGAVVASPAHWDGTDWAKFAALAGTTAAVFAFDQRLYDAVQRNRTEFSEGASPYISKCGNGTYLAGLMAAMYLSGEAFDSPGLRTTALQSLESFLTASAVVLGLKFVVGRARPYTHESDSSFHPFSIASRYVSFPSGDAAGAFAVATAIAERSEAVVVDVLAYSLAGLVAFYRVHDRKHWPSDVLAGSALGFFVARKVARLNRDRASNRMHISIQWGKERQAVTLAFSF
jgi:membrane-associated phospholipid phosphatase